MRVGQGAHASLSNCSFWQNGDLCGVAVKGRGSALRAERTLWHDNERIGVIVVEGGAAELAGCEISHEKCGIMVQARLRLFAFEVLIVNNTHEGVQYERQLEKES
jgi:hypothetical protein